MNIRYVWPRHDSVTQSLKFVIDQLAESHEKLVRRDVNRGLTPRSKKPHKVDTSDAPFLLPSKPK